MVCCQTGFVLTGVSERLRRWESWEGRGDGRGRAKVCYLLLVQQLLIQFLHQLRLLVDLLILKKVKEGGEERVKEKYKTSLIVFHYNHTQY